MPLSRRQLTIGCAVLLPSVAGCSEFTDTEPLREVYLELVNQSDEPHTFHFVLESDDGLGRWRDVELDPGAAREVTIEPESEREWTGYHAVASDKRTSGSLLGQGDGQTCLQLDVRITDDEITATMSTDRPLCDS